MNRIESQTKTHHVWVIFSQSETELTVVYRRIRRRNECENLSPLVWRKSISLYIMFWFRYLVWNRSHEHTNTKKMFAIRLSISNSINDVKNPWRKFLEYFLKEILGRYPREHSWRKSPEEFLLQISKELPGGYLRRNSPKKSLKEFLEKILKGFF